MQKKFITNLAFLISLNLLVKPFWLLGIDRAVQNTIQSQSYGLYYALFNFSLLFNIFLDLGITNFNNRNISQNMQLVHKHLSGILVLRLILTGLYFLLSITSAIVVGYRGWELQLLSVLLFNQVLLSTILYLRSNISGLHYFKTDSVISVLDRLLMIIICGLLLLFKKEEFKNHIEWYAYAQTGGYLITAAITFFVLHDKISMQRLNWNPVFLMLILKKSAPFAILIFLMAFYNCIDTVMIERLLPVNGAEQAGVYAQAKRLLEASNMIAFLFAGLLLPLFAHLLKKRESVLELTKLSYCLISVPAVLLIGCCIFYKYEIMHLLYRQHEEESAQILGILIFCFFAISSNYIFGTLLTANGSLWQLNIMAISGVVISVLLNLYLIPRYQAIGAAYAGVITQFTTAFIQVALSHRIFHFKIDYKLLGLFVAFGIITLALTYASKRINVDWKPALAAAMIASILVAFALRLINIRNIREILKREE